MVNAADEVVGLFYLKYIYKKEMVYLVEML